MQASILIEELVCNVIYYRHTYYIYWLIDLNPRDDLESLAYTLLFLLKGSLPWQTYSEHGTVLGRNAQVRGKKQIWTGSKFSKYCPREFGQLVNHARGLKFAENINYSRLRALFANVSRKIIFSRSKGKISASWGCTVFMSSPPNYLGWPTASAETRPRPCPVEAGQLVSVRIDARTSIEGYSLQGLTDLWHNPLLSSKEFSTSARPAIVIDVSFDKNMSLFKVQVVSVGKDTPVQSATPAQGVSCPVTISSYPPRRQPQEATVVLRPAFPMWNTYCYAFPRASWFYCLPNQVGLLIHISDMEPTGSHRHPLAPTGKSIAKISRFCDKGLLSLFQCVSGPLESRIQLYDTKLRWSSKIRRYSSS
jgi:casein kinase I family protein HRR25